MLTMTLLRSAATRTHLARSASLMTMKSTLSTNLPGQVRFKASQAVAAAVAAPETTEKRNLKVLGEIDDLDDEASTKIDSGAETSNASEALFSSLLPGLQKNLHAMGVTTLFPVQMQTLEACRSGKDMVVRSKTGSGKTLAFALPTVEKLLGTKAGKAIRGSPRAIVLAPTRELALQTHREFEKLAPSLNCVAVYGGASIVTQAQQLRDTVDVVVGTPGRVKDFLDRGTLKLDQIQVAILDEADEMLKVGFYEAIQEIYTAMPDKSKRQNLLFSATVPPEIRTICEDFLNKPTFVDLVGDSTSKIPDTVEMCMMPVLYTSRVAALSAVLASHSAGSTKESPRRALVFCSTKRECEDLSRSFRSPEAGLNGAALHGDMSQAAREEVLGKFRDGSCLVLVATDVAARGLDIPEVDLVVHYSLPRDQDSFVHRSGRTGRAGRKGTNIMFYDPAKDKMEIRSLERSVGLRFIKRAVPCGPEMIKKQALAISGTLSLTGAALRWIKPVADQLRENDAKKGTDSLAAALMSLMGGGAIIRSISALTGRSGSNTICLKRSDGSKIETNEVIQLLKTLPAVLKSGAKGSQIRELHRTKNSNDVLLDISETLVGDLLTEAEKTGFVAEIVEGVVPDSVPEITDTRGSDRSFTKQSNDKRGGGGRNDYGSRRDGGRGGDRSYQRRDGGYSRDGGYNRDNRDDRFADRRGPSKSSFDGGQRRGRRDDY